MSQLHMYYLKPDYKSGNWIYDLISEELVFVLKKCVAAFLTGRKPIIIIWYVLILLKSVFTMHGCSA